MAVLEFDSPGEWKLELAEKLNIKIAPEQKGRLLIKYQRESRKRAQRRMPHYLALERKRRFIKRSKILKSDSKTNDYIFANDPAKQELKDFDT